MTPDDARALLAALPQRVAAAVDATLDTVAEAAADETRRLLREATQRPSPAGAPPSDLSGVLAGAVTTALSENGVDVTVAVPFAEDLEYGTYRLAARPFLRPAVAGTADAARSAFAGALSRAVVVALDDHA